MVENSEIKEIYELGERPPIGIIPKNMHAFCVRQERFGEPNEAWITSPMDSLIPKIEKLGISMKYSSN